MSREAKLVTQYYRRKCTEPSKTFDRIHLTENSRFLLDWRRWVRSGQASVRILPSRVFNGGLDQDAAVKRSSRPVARFGPRLRTNRIRMRSSNSAGAYIPLGRNTSATVSRS